MADHSTLAYIEAVLPRPLDALEPRLIRNRHGPCGSAGQFDARPAEIRRPLRSNPEPDRTRELADRIRAAGLPA